MKKLTTPRHPAEGDTETPALLKRRNQYLKRIPSLLENPNEEHFSLPNTLEMRKIHTLLKGKFLT